jgi:hypothetical protein
MVRLRRVIGPMVQGVNISDSISYNDDMVAKGQLFAMVTQKNVF